MCPILKGWGSSIKRDGAERGREQNAYAEELTEPQRLLQRTDAEEELPHGHLGSLVKSDADGAHVSNYAPMHEIKTDSIHVARYPREKQAFLPKLSPKYNLLCF